MAAKKKVKKVMENVTEEGVKVSEEKLITDPKHEKGCSHFPSYITATDPDSYDTCTCLRQLEDLATATQNKSVLKRVDELHAVLEEAEQLTPTPNAFSIIRSKLTVDKVLKCFPLKTPRDLQVVAIEKTVAAIVNGAEFAVLEAPVGTGKSPLGVAFAKAMGDRSYMLTLTEQLQEQYVGDFKTQGLVTLKGRAKFGCHTLGKGATCADGKHLKPKCTNCPYTVGKALALASPHVVANYHSFYANVSKANAWANPEDADGMQRPVLIADEAHSIENFLLGEISVLVRLNKLSVQLAPPPNTTDDVEPYFDYLREELIPKLKAEKPMDPKVKEELAILIGKLTFVLNTRDARWIPERGVMMSLPGKPFDPSWFALKPLRVDRWGPELYGQGQFQLFMSGTILDGLQFCSSIGLDPSKGEHIELDSPFPAENRPIYVGELDMTKKSRDTSWPIASQMVENIMTEHKNEKGLLLCPSNEMLKAMQQKLSRVNQARLIFAAGENRIQQYQKHMASRIPTVLAASGFWEGADLKGDASRFQIIPQLPRPMWHGQVAARAEAPGGDKWYRWMTLQKFIQGTGRSVRSEDDYAVTYVFDVSLRAELARGSKSMIPGWVRKACHLVESA